MRAVPVAFGGPRAWNRETLRAEDLLITLPPAWAERLRTVRTERPGAAGGPPPPAGLVGRIARQLSDGPGVAVVRGWPLDGLGEPECHALARWFGAYLGIPRPSDATQGHVVVTAVPPPGQPGHPAPGPGPGAIPGAGPVPGAGAGVAGHDRDDRELAFHTDRAGPPGPPRILGLLCVRQAAHGGESLLVSGCTVHDRLLARHPSALPRLYRDFHFGRGDGFDRVYPVFRRRGNRLLVRYNRHWIERGGREAGAPVSSADSAALDAFDEILADPGSVVRIRLRPGDLLLLDNTSVLHGRTAFTDAADDPRHRRCLVRVWLD
ncbi:TauD/TfdA family dioxygenase [Streptomyces sp. NPDC013953]|uniref:TauD/TfdA family dioxygenase n=1 Tax=Streptomyces sp. NPDC013953 TaxID=3364868 RepID=UPI003701392C